MHQKLEHGILAFSSAQVISVLGGFILHVLLARFWGPEVYGLFVLVISILVWIEFIPTGGIPTAVAKFIAENEANARRIISSAVKIQIALSIVISVLVFCMAPLISYVLSDISLTFYLRLAAIDIPFLGIAVLFQNVLRGFRAFFRHALTIVIYALGKVVLIVFIVLLGFSLSGALVGNILASVVSLIVARSFVRLENGIKKNARSYHWSEYLKFAAPYTLYWMMFNLLRNLDLFFVKALLSNPVETGYYGAALSIARVPYLISYGFTITLLPLMANSVFEENKELGSVYVSKSLRFLLILLVPAIFLVSGTSKELISVIYSRSYSEAAPVLSILIFGFGFLAIMVSLNTMLIANNEFWKVLSGSFFLMLLDASLNFKLIPIYGTEGAALAMTVTALVGSVISGAFVFRKFGTLVDMRSSLRVFASGTSVFFISKAVSVSGGVIVVKYVFLFLLYCALLYFMREIKQDEVEKIKSYVGRFRLEHVRIFSR